MDPWLFQFDLTVERDFRLPVREGINATVGSRLNPAESINLSQRKTRAAPAILVGTFTYLLRRKIPFGILILISAARLFAAGSVLAQGVPTGNNASSFSGETTQELNRSLEESSRALSRASSAAEVADSRIGPDDLLEITVFEAPEMNSTLRVSANGEISLQLLGPVKAAGLTPRELELVLQELLRRTYMKNPHVGVFVQELQSHPVSVVGAVKNPGVFQIRGAKTVIELLSMAQGLTDDAGDTVMIMRSAGVSGAESLESKDSAQPTGGTTSPATGDSAITQSAQPDKGEIVTVNLKDLLDSADPTLNVSVRPGDIVKVSRAGIVYVVGEVNKPGGFVLSNNENISVLQALALAQGLTRTSAKSQTRIIRTDQHTGRRTEIPVDLGRILASKAPDPTLQSRDIVFIPNSSAKSAFYRGTETVLYSAAGAAIYRW